MKAQNLNNSSRKTRKTIKAVFARMLSEKREIGKISVVELCRRADISRGTFYAHYDDIYGVAEDYEKELIEQFFDNARLLSLTDLDQFVDPLFEYIRNNDENYRLLCRSNELLFAAGRLSGVVTGKLLELCHSDSRIRDKKFLDLEIRVFVDGLFIEYVKYCRGVAGASPDDLYLYTKRWLKDFIARRTVLGKNEEPS
mgnify:FL=1